jgi:hypothetical protein
MSGFSIDWLDLREAADHRARDDGLLVRAIHWLQDARPPGQSEVMINLGAGTGSTLRAFTRSKIYKTGSAEWRPIEHDSQLLAEIQRRHGQSTTLKPHELDLAKTSELPLSDTRLVTASALFDLVSANFIDSLVDTLIRQCQQQPVGLYAALTYDGTTQWTQTHPLDETILAAFNRDQFRDKGFGPSLGPNACHYLERRLVEAGFEVSCAESPWILGGKESELVTELAKGIGHAVAEDPALDSEALREWLEFRQANVTRENCLVGHRDLLALPPA